MKKLVLIAMLLPLVAQTAEPQSVPTREEFTALKAEIE